MHHYFLFIHNSAFYYDVTCVCNIVFGSYWASVKINLFKKSITKFEFNLVGSKYVPQVSPVFENKTIFHID